MCQEPRLHDTMVLLEAEACNSHIHPEACAPCTMCQQLAMTSAVTSHFEAHWRLCCECVLLQQIEMQPEQSLLGSVSQSGCQG